MSLRGEDFKGISEFLEKKQLKYTSHEIQNEILSLMSKSILRDKVKEIQSAVFFTIMVDETTDMSNKEQVVIVIRWVSEELFVHEEFFGLYETDSIQAKALVDVIKDSLLRLNLKLEHCRGQCYDGASNMSGIRNGVAKILTNEEPRAVYTHCYGHCLNLAIGDAIKNSKVMKSCLEVVYEISKLIKKSPKRDAIFQRLKSEIAPETPGFRVLCPTRWTVRALSLQSVLDNFEVLLGVWEESNIDSETRARIIGVEVQMLSFDFLFGLLLGSLLLRHGDNLSKTLQHKTMSSAEGQHLAKLTVDVLKSLRVNNKFALFYEKVLLYQQKLGINPPALPRKRRAPRRLEVGTSADDHPSSVEDHYRRAHYEALDVVIQAIADRFDQPGYQVYRNLEELILKASTGCEYDTQLDFVCEFYKDDISKFQLQAQLPLFNAVMTEKHKSDLANLTIEDVIKSVQGVPNEQRVALSNVWILLKLLLVMPATNASSERTFSALWRVKTYLRTTMTQERLNNLMVLHVHQDATDKLDLKTIANDFVKEKERRFTMFGNFR